jgi:hypothetical protein
MTKMHDWWLKYITTTKWLLNNGQNIDGLCTCSLQVPYGFGRFSFVILVQIQNSMIFVLLIFFSSHIFLFNMKCENALFSITTFVELEWVSSTSVWPMLVTYHYHLNRCMRFMHANCFALKVFPSLNLCAINVILTNLGIVTNCNHIWWFINFNFIHDGEVNHFCCSYNIHII